MKIRMKMLLCDIDKGMGHLADLVVNWSLNRYETTGCELYWRIGRMSTKMCVFFLGRHIRRGTEILLWFDTHGKKAQA